MRQLWDSCPGSQRRKPAAYGDESWFKGKNNVCLCLFSTQAADVTAPGLCLLSGHRFVPTEDDSRCQDCGSLFQISCSIKKTVDKKNSDLSFVRQTRSRHCDEVDSWNPGGDDPNTFVSLVVKINQRSVELTHRAWWPSESHKHCSACLILRH